MVTMFLEWEENQMKDLMLMTKKLLTTVTQI